MADALIVVVSAPDGAQGEALAESLVAERLAACVNVVRGVRSIYRWQGDVQRDDEVLLLIKTTGESYAALERRIFDLHPYDVPEVLALRIERGAPAYLQWLVEQVG